MVTTPSLYIRHDPRFRCPSSVADVYVLSAGQYVPTAALDVATIKTIINRCRTVGASLVWFILALEDFTAERM